MKKIPQSFYKMPSAISHFVGVPLFLFAFVIIYSPLGFNEYLDMGRGLCDFNITIISVITLACLVGTRLAMYFLRGVLKLTYPLYIGWCLAEVLIYGMFNALFVWLMKGANLPYMQVLGSVLSFLFAIVIFPYGFVALWDLIAESDEVQDASEDNLIRFKDENQKLKITIAAGSVLFIEAKDNYVKINYLNNDKLKTFTLRSSMKRCEELLKPYGLERCHRTYILNPSHVKILRKDTHGFIYADLDTAGAPAIPVSKTYYDTISKLL